MIRKRGHRFSEKIMLHFVSQGVPRTCAAMFVTA